ncbi:hypothetical protein D3C75_1050590 [compost metagenome]
MISKLPRNVRAWIVSSTRIAMKNKVMNRTKLTRYSHGINIPKGINAIVFPKATILIRLGCRRSAGDGKLMKFSGIKIKV